MFMHLYSCENVLKYANKIMKKFYENKLKLLNYVFDLSSWLNSSTPYR